MMLVALGFRRRRFGVVHEIEVIDVVEARRSTVAVGHVR